MTDQERLDLVANELQDALAQANKPVLVMGEDESGGPCRYCRQVVKAGESYTVGADGFEDHAGCA